MQTQRMQQLLDIYRDGLLEDTIPFWEKHIVDCTYGGFAHYVDADGTLVCSDKGMWAQGRITWLFARLYNHAQPLARWLELSRHGLDFIQKHGFDSDGRMFYAVTRDGRPLRKRRYMFTETFGVVALAEYARASGDEQAATQAHDLFSLLIKYHTTPCLLEPKVFPETRSMKSHAMPMILLATVQVLRNVHQDPLYDRVVEQSIEEVLHHFLKPEFQALLETVGPEGEFIDEPVGRCVNPGHAIETSWFLMEEARHRGNDKALIDAACQILDWSLELGWDNEYGGILYFCDVKGLPCEQYEHDMKLWWPHNEALYATLLAYHLTGNQSYERWHEKIHEWAYAHFPDTKNGEWFGYLHRDGTVSSTIKSNFWKGPFHLPRMQLNCWKLLEQMIRT